MGSEAWSLAPILWCILVYCGELRLRNHTCGVLWQCIRTGVHVSYFEFCWHFGQKRASVHWKIFRQMQLCKQVISFWDKASDQIWGLDCFWKHTIRSLARSYVGCRQGVKSIKTFWLRQEPNVMALATQSLNEEILGHKGQFLCQ